MAITKISKVVSPLTHKFDSKFIESFESKKIVAQYREMGVDVSRFFKGIDEIRLFECRQTGYRFFHPNTIYGDSLFYEHLAAGRDSYYSNRWEHDVVERMIQKNQNVLEIGTGYGAFLSRLRFKGVQANGIEINPTAVDKCLELGYDVRNSTIQVEAVTYPETYDVIVSFQVLEHIWDTRDYFQSCLKALKKGGRIIFAVPNNNPYLYVNDKYHTLNLPPHHAGLWNKKAIINLEKTFPIKLRSLKFEPLDYAYFVKFQIKNHPSKTTRYILKLMNRFSNIPLKFVLTRLIKGRNLVAVYEKK